MPTHVRSQIVRLLNDKRHWKEYLAALTLLALAVTLGVASVLTQQGHAATQEVRVLDCPVTGTVAHAHDDSCYDADGSLVCPLPEVEAHAHDDSCYAEERVLVCGLEEGEGHTHTDGCYEVTRTLVCGRDEVTEAHVHGPGCFRTVEVEVPDEELADDKANDQDSTGAGSSEPAVADREPTSQTHPRQSFSHEFTDADGNLVMRVEVEAPEGALPVGTTMAATWIDPATMSQKQQDAVDGAVAAKAGGQVLGMQAVDIEFLDADGTEVEPAAPVVVTMTSGLVDTDDAPMVVHIDDLTDAQLHQQEQDLRDGKSAEEAEPDRTAEALDQLSDQALERRDIATGDDRLSFESDRFSTYVLAVTSLRKVMQASDGATVTVTVDAPAEAGIPQGAELRVQEISQGSADWQGYEAQALGAIGADESELARFFDIAIVGEDGAEVQPAEPVSVEIELADAPEGADASVVHFGAGAELVPATEDAGVATFDATGFSVWGVVYTVDFHWNVDGEVYEYSLAGGDSIGLRKLVEILGIVDAQADDADATLDEFIANVESVNFSDESLVKVAKVTEGITAGALKQKYGLECEYSAELTEVEREAMDSKVFNAPDWALVSLKAFDTDEWLTVEMKTGEVLRIAVTDAQIQKDYLSASGETYTITVTYEDDAEIPDGCDLQVEEILGDTSAYNRYLSESAEELGVTGDEVSFARFFDITIVDAAGQKVEPKAPVLVSIAYKDAVEVGEGESLSVVHFAESGTEVIADTSVSEDQKEIVYQQDSFSVTGTIVTAGDNVPGGNKYMVLIEYPASSNTYYIVNNDGTLTAVDYNNGSVSVDNPMLWTIEGSNRNGHIYFNSEATGFNYQDTAADYYRRYIDPASATGITEENDSNITLEEDWSRCKIGKVVADNGRQTILDETNLSYYDNRLYREPGGTGPCIGIVFDEEGAPVRIKGNTDWNEAAKVVFASADSVPGVGARTHTVDHIDISITGVSDITVPLAYGTYYYKDQNNQWQEYVVNSDISIELTNNNVSIEADDMKSATIKAFDKNGNELDDAFVVTGYSSNSGNDERTQVRIEGRFKVANLNDNVPNWQDANSNGWKTARYDNKIQYTVSAVKTLSYDLVESDNGYGQLYEKLADGSYRPLNITVDVNMSASFNYWDEDNECPALDDAVMRMPVHETWLRGGIPASNAYGNSYLSGMDFKLGGDAEEANSKIVAIEITKMIVDEGNHLIPLNTSIVQSFDIYGSNTDDQKNMIGFDVPSYTDEYSNYGVYGKAHSKDVSVGTSGMGLVFDYDVSPGMYYIEENTDDIRQTIIDADGNEWAYKETRLDTEYVWRNDMYTGHHVSDTYADLENDSYRSLPEVVGNYTGLYNTATTEQAVDNYNSTNWRWYNTQKNQWETGTYRNGFLEFFVYNIYKPVYSEIDVTVKKVDKDNLNEASPTTLPGATFTLEKYTTADCAAESKDPAWTDVTIRDADNDGLFTFSELTEGYYKLVETVCPAGYVKAATDPVFHVKPNSDGDLIVVLVNEQGHDIDNTTTDLLKIDNAATGGPVLTVGNEPGTPLPNAGGPGTGAFMTVGAALMTGSALLLMRRRRTA